MLIHASSSTRAYLTLLRGCNPAVVWDWLAIGTLKGVLTGSTPTVPVSDEAIEEFHRQFASGESTSLENQQVHQFTTARDTKVSSIRGASSATTATRIHALGAAARRQLKRFRFIVAGAA